MEKTETKKSADWWLEEAERTLWNMSPSLPARDWLDLSLRMAEAKIAMERLELERTTHRDRRFVR